MSSKSENFIAHLRRLDRGAFATLRRSLREGPGKYPPAYRYIEPFLVRDDEGAEPSRRERDAYYLVAGLFTLKERPGEPVASGPRDRRFDLGASAGRLYLIRDRGPSIEKRFITLLDADREQLPYRLRQMVTLLASEDVPIAWAHLVDDLRRWDHPGRYVQRNWARSFYRPEADATEPTSEGSPA